MLQRAFPKEVKYANKPLNDGRSVTTAAKHPGPSLPTDHMGVTERLGPC